MAEGRCEHCGENGQLDAEGFCEPCAEVYPPEPRVKQCPSCGSLTREFAYKRGCTDPWHQRTCPTCGNIGEGEPWGTCPDPFHTRSFGATIGAEGRPDPDSLLGGGDDE